MIVDALRDAGQTEWYVRQLHDRHSTARLVVVASFPRADEVACWRQAGASAVLGKPLVNNDLAYSLL